jgi:MATE family multidrug resistance protein
VLAVGFAIPTAATFLVCDPVLRGLGQRPELVPMASRYIIILIPSVLPFYLFQILRTTLQAYHRTAAVVWTIVVANLVNVLLNWLLIYGHLGMAEMGSDGSAYATTVSRWVMFLALAAVGHRQLGPHWKRWTRRAFEFRALRRIVRVGAPIGTQIFLEFGAFATVLLLMGRISVSAQAGHQVAINLASMTYMFGLGISSATGVRVSHGIGRGDLSGARWSAVIGMVVGIAVMGGFGLLFLLFPERLAAMFTESRDVGAFAVAVSLLPIAAVFQVMDGVQVVALGILRGVADTKVPMLINLVGFWCLGIPSGILFAFVFGGGPGGLWWGLTVGLGSVALLLVWRVWGKIRGELARTVIDDSDALDPA